MQERSHRTQHRHGLNLSRYCCCNAAASEEPAQQTGHRMLDRPPLWTRMRRVYAPLWCESTGRNASRRRCTTVLACEMYDVRRLQRMLQNRTAAPPAAATLPLARYSGPRTRVRAAEGLA
jgi:hypothetical protein